MKLGINAGHTLKGAGSGAVGILSESDETRAVVKELNALLKTGGHTVVDCTIDSASSQNVYLQKVVEFANRQDLDYFISIHFNKTKGAKGVEVYTYGGRQFADALEVCKNISVLGFVNRGVKSGTGLYVIRKTKAKSMLIEVCFVDDPDASKYKQLGARKIAEVIYKAVVDTNISNTSSNFLIKVANVAKGDVLNIREKADASSRITGKLAYNDPNEYTIVETKKVGSETWGKLKSKIGWVNLRYTKRV